MAVLGIIHRTVLGLGPEHFREYFKRDAASKNPAGRETVRRHDVQLRSYRTGRCLNILGNSIIGAIDIYNLLPASVVAADNVSTFQKRLQANLVIAANGNDAKWKELYSPRLPLYNHPLRKAIATEVHVNAGNGNGNVTIVTNCVNGWLAFGQ